MASGPTFVFLHVGPDASLPALLVRSIRAVHGDAQIIQCSDHATAAVAGVDEVRRFEGDTTTLMTFRLASFAALEQPAPALYLDTDMLCVGPLEPQSMLGDCEVAVCSREFGRAALFNTRFGGLDLTEYAGKTIGEIYPYVACATVTRGAAFWADCLANLASLPPKFRRWYGDQEAIRNVVSLGKYRTAHLPESVYGCLPERRTNDSAAPRLLHFKGAARKPLMLEYAKRLRIA